MKFATVLDRDEDGMWIAECPSIPSCVSQGKTREEALANIKERLRFASKYVLSAACH
jgi:predicted RNase H-like HicB family nuclease